MWCEFIEQLSPECEFNSSASEAEILVLEKALGVALPDDLRSLLKEMNGANDKYGFGLVWSTQQIQRDNQEFRANQDFKELYMPFDNLLLFADAGNGDLYAFRILDGEIRRPDIFVWNHENDSRAWAASFLRKDLEWRLTGKLDA